MTAGEEATRIMAGTTSLSPVSASMWQHVVVSLLWLALSAQWMTVVPIIVPDQVAVIVGADSAAKEGISGTILAAGAVVALIVAPISGALSDRSQHPRGRRRLFLIAGVLGSCVGLLLLLPFGPGATRRRSSSCSFGGTGSQVPTRASYRMSWLNTNWVAQAHG